MTLTPDYAAALANNIYSVKNEATQKGFIFKYKKDMELGEASTNPKKSAGGKLASSVALTGTTGGIIFLKSTHVMGITAYGQGPQFEKEAFVALKGTASGFDALTDLNAGLKRASTGGLVHQGFFDTFQSFLPQLKEFAANLTERGVHTVHCVGHSLGGALASLVADWLSSNIKVQVNLYTFGGPRPGLSLFSDACSNRVGSKNIYRVYHNLDPVPMVPTWPFVHMTDDRGDYRLACNMAQNPAKYHSCATYVESVGKSDGNWSILKSYNEPKLLESTITGWLKSDGPVSLTLNTLKVFNAALLWVLKKVANVLFIGLVGAGTTTFTLLDRMAYLMHQGHAIGKKVGYWVGRLLKRMAKMIGVTITKTTNMTLSLIRSMFFRMFHMISDLTRRASMLL
ncbi:lipase family protein [Aestuariicella sp. G3-2]|uniref:lipase family protein n=1 Tax=Pseudomaricurvus albidus TaxID=2842452 RepID=UPI001C0E848D|nr:lipase family protein [Aestuariicella albida]MBU3069854.1 lipase family protein [Aestuariicella albida]